MVRSIPANLRALTWTPEFNVVFFAYLLNSPWEFLQVPLFERMPLTSHWDGVKACTAAAVGDSAISLAAKTGIARDPKPRARCEVDQHRQPLGGGVEINRLNRPRGADAQRRFEELVVQTAAWNHVQGISMPHSLLLVTHSKFERGSIEMASTPVGIPCLSRS